MTTITLWAGDESGFDLMLAAKSKADDIQARVSSGDMPEIPSMYSRQGSVGVIDIAGPLVPGDAGFMQLFGITGYDNIRQAIIKGLNDKEAKSLMLNVDSTGGAVNGVADTARFIKAASRIKPITAYADTAASAAYWLGSAAAHITASETGIMGSIGVLRVHTETSKQDQQEGVTRTILRAGKYKALINPIEPLSAEARAQADVMLQDTYKVFTNMVAENRHTTQQLVHERMADGREFMGQRALDAGLVDKIGTYEDALAHAGSLGGSANRGGSATNSIVKGAIVDNNASNPTQGTEVTKPTLDADMLAAVVTGEEVTDPATAAASASDPVVKTGDITEIQAQLATATETLTTTQAELATVKQQLTEAQASVVAGEQAAVEAGKTIASLTAVVSAYTANMVIALGGKADTLDGMDAAALLAKHAEVSTTFKKNFKTGGVARSTQQDETEVKAAAAAAAAKATVSPLFMHLVHNAPAK